MTDLIRYAAALEGAAGRPLPPVSEWNPSRTGEIDLTIRRDGAWAHEGQVIERARLVRLFSTVLRKDGDDYFLVTPAEKLKIRVEDAPFLAVSMRERTNSGVRELVFATNVGDEVVAGRDRPISYRGPKGQKRAYVLVRDRLEALISRSVFFDLVAAGETRETGGEDWFGVESSGVFFPLSRAADMDQR